MAQCHAKTIPKTIEVDRRIAFHQELSNVPGIKKAYFQPPASVRMVYPCIVYSRSGGDTKFGDDNPYLFRRRYTVTVIDPDPDSVIPDYIAMNFQMCVADRTYTADNLYHHVFTIYW